MVETRLTKAPESNTARFHLRHAKPSDAEEVIALVNAAYRYENEGPNAFKLPDEKRLNHERFKETLENTNLILASAPSDDKILGTIAYQEKTAFSKTGDKERVGYFGLLAVDPNAQGQGIGEHLVKVAEGLAQKNGIRKLQLQVVDHSAHLIDWYKRLGYHEYGKRVWEGDFLTKPSQFVMMQKSINLNLSV